MTRHRHAHAYAALVFVGSYVEAGDRGRVRVGPGDVVFHRPYDAHRNTFARRDVAILNLPSSDAVGSLTATVDDVGAIVRLAERDTCKATLALRAACRPSRALLDDWPDRLAAALAMDAPLVLGDWAIETGFADQAHPSRIVATVTGSSPGRLRVQSVQDATGSAP